MFGRTLAAVAAVVLLSAGAAHAQAAGWRSYQEGQYSVAEPEGLAPGQVFKVRFTPPQPLKGGLVPMLDAHVKAEAAADPTTAQTEPAKARPAPGGPVVEAGRAARGPDGQPRVMFYRAGLLPDGRVLMARVEAQGDQAMLQRYLPEASVIITTLLRPGAPGAAAPR